MFLFKSSLWRRLLPLFLAAACIPLVFLFITGFFEGSFSQKSLDLAAESVHRAAVQCYALEGAFPAELSYLQEKYGVTVDTRHYFIDYQYIASNLLPDITVLPVGK